MAAQSREKSLIIGALALLLASAGAFGWLTWRQGGMATAPIAQVQLGETPYAAAVAEAGPVNTDTWNPPAAQTRGRDWVYDAFTPPEIFYNARSKQFTVKPPSGVVEGDPEEPFGLDLVSVRPEPFRLQLIGYFGEGASARGTFQNLLTGEVFLAAAGRRVPNLALTIKTLEIRTQPVALANSMTTQQRVATAVVRDERSNRDVTLTHRERQFTGTVSAFVAATGSNATREVRVGETFKLGEATYRIDRVQLTPPTVEVTKTAPDPAPPERRTLTPREPDAAEGAEPPGS